MFLSRSSPLTSFKIVRSERLSNSAAVISSDDFTSFCVYMEKIANGWLMMDVSHRKMEKNSPDVTLLLLSGT